VNDYLVGTAGHVDHGKTALLRALTGIDCDRLPEEKRRGITLDLGFAHLDAGEVTLGFVDVPGHERFLHNALAGLGGLRLLLLVVAADEGVREQTREHLAIAELLGIPEALVAITKLDLVDDELAELVELEVAELLEPTPWADAPTLRVSAETGEGIDALRAELIERAQAAGPLAAAADPIRLPIDRAFSPRGQGVVITGTLVRGTVRTGDELTLTPAGKPVRVRSLQVHGTAREAAAAGARTALQLAGVELAELSRGEELIGRGGPPPARSLLVRARLLSDSPVSVGAALEIRLHLHTGEQSARLRALDPARLEAGGEGLVEVRTAKPIVAARGDRVVFRRPSPAATIGGGEVLDPFWRRPRRTDLADRLAVFAGDDDEALVGWAERSIDAGLTAATAAARLGRAVEPVAERLAALAGDGRLLAGGEHYFHPQRLAALEARARTILDRFFATDRLAESMPKAEFVRKLLARRAAPRADLHLRWLAAQKVLSVAGDAVAPPGRKAQFSDGESGLAGKIVAEYERAGLEPPSPGEAARRLAAKPEIVEGLVKHLIGRGRLVRLPIGLIFAAATLERLATDVAAAGWESFSVADFKNRFGLSRKWAIPLLEHLDSKGVTRRAGDRRQLVRRTDV
jgi:selenocysteine-specific elongation factor